MPRTQGAASFVVICKTSIYTSLVDLVFLTLLGAIWGASFLFMRVAAPVLGPVSLIQWRLIFATLVLIPFAFKRRGSLKGKDFNHLIVIGIINSAIPFTLLAYSSMHLSAGMASMMNACAPFFAAIWGVFLFQQKLTARQSSGLALGFLGVWILVYDKISFAHGILGAEILPFLTGIIAAACYGFAANYSKKHLTHLDSKTVAFGIVSLPALHSSHSATTKHYLGTSAHKYSFSP